MSNSVRVAMVQDNFLVGDIAGNTRRIIDLVRSAADTGADLAVFPELALCGYPPEDLLFRHEFSSKIDTALAEIANASKGIDVLLGLPLRRDDFTYNAAAWLRNGECIAEYYKQSLPNYLVFDELRYFSHGQYSCVVELKGTRFGVLICEDAWEQEPAKASVEDGAESLIVLNASPFHGGKYNDRVEVLGQRARENGVSVFYANLVGGQDELVFDGESLVVNREGEVVRRAAAFESSIELIDLEDGEPKPVTEGTAQALDTEQAVYSALLLGVKDFIHKNGFSGVVVGLSGGVDSALTLAVAVDALGAENVHAVMMPSRFTSEMSLEDAEAQATIMGVRYDIISIESAFDSFLGSLDPVFSGAEHDTTEENIQARIRGVILMAISNKTGRMVLTTGNKSEMAVGYATLYGDMCGGFAPLKDVYKTLVYRLCRYRNSLGAVIPERVITREPTAELREGQIDLDSLPEYEDLDRILEMSVELDKSIDEVVAEGFERETVEYVVRMVQVNEYKRRQSAPGVRITRRAFGRDRRYPITSGYRSK